MKFELIEILLCKCYIDSRAIPTKKRFARLAAWSIEVETESLNKKICIMG